eukprot:2129254-Amphidinium_carterae.3
MQPFITPQHLCRRCLGNRGSQGKEQANTRLCFTNGSKFLIHCDSINKCGVHVLRMMDSSLPEI